LSFITYEPWALSRFKYRDEYTEKNIPEWKDVNLYSMNGKNLMEWIDSINLKQSTYTKSNANYNYRLDDGLPHNNLALSTSN